MLTLSAKKILLEGRAHRATLLKPKHPNQSPSSVIFNTLVDDEGNESLSIKDQNSINSNSKIEQMGKTWVDFTDTKDDVEKHKFPMLSSNDQ